MTDPATPDPNAAPEAAKDAPKTFDAEYVEKLRKEAADYRTKAKANAEAAEELARIKEASKTEAEKAAEAHEATKAENAKLQAAIQRLRIQNKYGVSEEDAELYLTASDEATLIKQAEGLAQRAPVKNPRAAVVPGEGKNPNQHGDGDPLREVSRQLFHRP